VAAPRRRLSAPLLLLPLAIAAELLVFIALTVVAAVCLTWLYFA
jgi:hypothetical protein